MEKAKQAPEEKPAEQPAEAPKKNLADGTHVVVMGTQAYGYNYSSLSDIANAGVSIPKMRLAQDDKGEYIEWFDTESKEWTRGARIVGGAPSKGMNAAQAYGSAITYARRYTTQLAMSVACDEDKALERQAPEPAPAPKVKEPDYEMIMNAVKGMDTEEELQNYYEILKPFITTKAIKNKVGSICAARKKQIAGANEQPAPKNDAPTEEELKAAGL